MKLYNLSYSDPSLIRWVHKSQKSRNSTKLSKISCDKLYSKSSNLKCLVISHSAYDILFLLFNHTKINIKHLSLEFWSFSLILWPKVHKTVWIRSWTLFLLAGFFPPLIWNLKEMKLKPTNQKARSFNPKRKSDGISVLKCYLAHLLRCSERTRRKTQSSIFKDIANWSAYYQYRNITIF